jgi:hypothetical protein
MNYNIATILAVIAIIFVLITYITSEPLVPVAVILLGLAIASTIVSTFIGICCLSFTADCEPRD